MKRIVIQCDICGHETNDLRRVRVQIGDKGWSGDSCYNCSIHTLDLLGDAIKIYLIPIPKRGRPAKPTELKAALAAIEGSVSACTICDEVGTHDETICHEHAGGGLKTECTACAGLENENLG